ncbi:Disintegrin and metalloproteinase domain-containing protein 5 [Fukomys damarensis]|uniref:Disintegrin and metalloproteinase domain-containing protein 5 n=1 Tax=Fukomys damarensis TaxID=885580 RepID=A0A091CS05_FUKDA|nr:Disintegrin and metalloproteinase domain-containing protein 5 [Fukomys damarensis]
MACNPKLAIGIALYPKTITVEAFSVVLVQLLGINLGLTYDNIHNCHCPGTTCIMNPEAITLTFLATRVCLHNLGYRGLLEQLIEAKHLTVLSVKIARRSPGELAIIICNTGIQQISSRESSRVIESLFVCHIISGSALKGLQLSDLTSDSLPGRDWSFAHSPLMNVVLVEGGGRAELQLC